MCDYSKIELNSFNLEDNGEGLSLCKNKIFSQTKLYKIILCVCDYSKIELNSFNLEDNGEGLSLCKNKIFSQTKLYKIIFDKNKFIVTFF